MALDPRIAEILALAEKSGRPPLENLPPPEARADYRRRADVFGLPPAPMRAIKERGVAGSAGPIPVRFYVPETAPPRGGMLIFFHGGGWTLGDRDTHDRACRYLARRAACRVASVDYRLAPEHPFPAAVEDCWAAWSTIAGDAAAWGADAARLAVGGDSAGGNLAAAVAQLAVAGGKARPCFQLLIYPAVDLARHHPSVDALAKGYLLTKVMIEKFTGHYVPDVAMRFDARASPLRARDLAGQPPALIQTAGFDPLQDEGAAYAQALAAAGVTVAYRHHPSLIHGYLQLAGYSPDAKAAVDEAAAALRAALA